HAVRDTEGNILYFEGTNSDITERKHAEDGLKESEHMLSQIIDFLPDPTIALDLDGKIIVWNRAMEELTGVRASEMMGKSDYEHAIPLYGKRRPILVDLCLNPSEEDEKFYKVIKKEENLLIAEGEMLEKQFIIWGKASRIFSRKGNIIGAIETIRDISDRKATEKVLKLSEERYRTIFENTGTAMIIMGEDSTISLVNSQFEALSGYSRNEVEGKMKWVDFVSREKNQPEENIISGNNESYIMDKAEKRKYVLITKAVIPGTNSNIASLQDISDRKLAEEALRASEGRYRFLEENIHDIIWISDLALHFVYVSPSIERICGYRPEEIIGTPWRSYTRDESHKGMEEIFAEGMELAGAHDPSLLSRTWSLELQQIIRSGEVIWTESTISFLVDEEGSPIGLLGMTRDINARKRAEEQMELYEEHMKRSQKIEAIGTLAGGIAHDFNNILSAIIGFSEVARDELPSGSETRDKIDEVLKASERAKDLVKQILTFSRQVDVKPKPLAMHLIVKEVIKLLRSSIPSTIHIEQDIGADSGFILADPTQIHQVVMNLCINAYHAMLNTGGTLTISLNQVLLENEISFVPHDLAAGAYVKFEVRDTGCGMDDAIMHRIFDPFFTTKEKGLGTGLGLAIVHGIVKDLGGEILVSSTPGSGSVFKVLLPRFGIDPVDHANDLDLITEGNGERILLVDDEVAIAEFGKVMLEEIGYPTSSYTSSTEAFKAFCNDPGGFDVVITDQTMPEMRGDQLALEILKIRQDMAIIVMTGYSDMLDPQRAASLGIKGFIHKPFSRRIIATAIQKVLNIPK
ncbi:MAG: PAS domain S-box protein, partial [Methanospirillum sp.]|uniref:PAS domain-containing hybrid sensor histidine kinase/response regulator n=1 Tax=Methanospirillum sp. TaxID=45200 RepID=UPI0023726D7F